MNILSISSSCNLWIGRYGSRVLLILIEVQIPCPHSLSGFKNFEFDVIRFVKEKRKKEA